MKKYFHYYPSHFLILIFTVLIAVSASAQNRDLYSLANGEYLGMNVLYDQQGDLFGYITLYNYGKVSEKTKKFEYVVLDKNLNPFANNTFEGDITAADYVGYINFKGKLILKPTQIDATLVGKKELYTPSSMVIDLKDNTVSRKVFYDYDHGTFKEMLQNNTWDENRKERKADRKENGFIYRSVVSEVEEGGYMVSEYDDYGSYVKNNRMIRFDEHKKEMWRYEYNRNGSKIGTQQLQYIFNDSNYLFGLLSEHDWDYHTYHLLVLDMKTGKVVTCKEITGAEKMLLNNFPTHSYGYLRNKKVFDDKIVITGLIGNNIFFKGFSRLLINRKTFAVELKELTYWQDIRQYLPDIDMFGQVEKGYLLDPRDIFFLKDGSIGFLFEKFKPAAEYVAPKTTDMLYVQTDKNFNIASVQLLEKEKSKWMVSDYLFSQSLNDDKDLVFFYRDYQKDGATKEKNWKLFINTFIDGKFKQEMVPISAKGDYLIFPYIAKEGYIMLQEYNKKAKYNQVRLEKLNF